jgi:hypothetical protein
MMCELNLLRRKEIMARFQFYFRKILIFCILFFMTFSINFSWSDEDAVMTVINQTDYYLHVIIGEESFLYVSPNRAVAYTPSESYATIVVEIFYSPGQDISGNASKTFVLEPSEFAGCTCNSSGGCDEIVTPPSNEVWEVIPEDLANNGSGGGDNPIKVKVWINDVLMAEDTALVSRDNFIDFCILGTNWSGSGVSTVYVDDIRLYSGSILLFEDDFESYTAGTHPSPGWITRFSGESAEISETVSHSGSKSFQLISRPNWARVEAYQLSSIPDSITYEARVYPDQAEKGVEAGFGKTVSSNVYSTYNQILFGNDGKLYFHGKNVFELQEWEPNFWYKIRVFCRFTSI